MSVKQIAFPFRQPRKTSAPIVDLSRMVGRSYAENEYVTVVIVSVCDYDNRRVLVRRRPGGTVSLPGWLVLSILKEEEKRRILVA